VDIGAVCRLFDVVHIKDCKTAPARTVLALGGGCDKIGEELRKLFFALVILPTLGGGLEL
jgi:hypothetical protein